MVRSASRYQVGIYRGKRLLKSGIDAGRKFIRTQDARRMVKSAVKHATQAAAGTAGSYAGSRMGRKNASGRSVKVAAAGLYKAGARTYGKKADFKKKHVKKINPKLRKAVKTVVAGYFPNGYYQEIYSQKFTFNANEQVVTAVPSGTTAPNVGMSVDAQTGHLFGPTHFLDAASILWNNKTPSQIKTVTDANNFDPENAKIHIRSSWAICKVKNHTQRLVNFTFVILDPKSKHASGNGPVSTWTNALTNDSTTGTTGANVLDVSPNTLYNLPGINPSMRANYRISREKVKLEPGQEYNYMINGPNNVDLHMKKYYRNGVYQNVSSSLSRYLMVIAYPDMIPDASGQTIRPSTTSSTLLSGVCIETNLYYNLTMPDTAGFETSGVPTAVQQLAMRRQAYAIRNYVRDLTVGSAGFQINESNTAATISGYVG